MLHMRGFVFVNILGGMVRLVFVNILALLVGLVRLSEKQKNAPSNGLGRLEG